jgi:hypothetical protein
MAGTTTGPRRARARRPEAERAKAQRPKPKATPPPKCQEEEHDNAWPWATRCAQPWAWPVNVAFNPPDNQIGADVPQKADVRTADRMYTGCTPA